MLVMNRPANPFTGLKKDLAGVLSSLFGLLFSLLFARRITESLNALESLFAQWQAGTLPPIPAPAPRAAPRAAKRPTSPRARRPAARRSTRLLPVAERAQRHPHPPIRHPQSAPHPAPARVPSRHTERSIRQPQTPHPTHVQIVPL